MASSDSGRRWRSLSSSSCRSGSIESDAALSPIPFSFSPAIGVGISSSVIPYICDQLAMSRLPRASFALLLALLPATATVIGAIVLRANSEPRAILIGSRW